MKKTNPPANFSFITKREMISLPWFTVSCKVRKTPEHLIRQMNYKTTFFKKPDAKN